MGGTVLLVSNNLEEVFDAAAVCMFLCEIFFQAHHFLFVFNSNTVWRSDLFFHDLHGFLRSFTFSGVNFACFTGFFVDFG